MHRRSPRRSDQVRGFLVDNTKRVIPIATAGGGRGEHPGKARHIRTILPAPHTNRYLCRRNSGCGWRGRMALLHTNCHTWQILKSARAGAVPLWHPRRSSYVVPPRSREGGERSLQKHVDGWIPTSCQARENLGASARGSHPRRCSFCVVHTVVEASITTESARLT